MNAKICFVGLGALIALAVATVANAATVSIGNLSGTPGQLIDIPVLISSGGSGDITFADLDFGLGAGGTTPIDIVAADRTTGTIWAAGVGSAVDFPSLPSNSRAFSGTTSAGAPPVAVTPDGILMVYTLDLTGTTVGTSFPLNPDFSGGTLIGNTNPGAGGYNETPSIVAGTLNIVPEPGTLAMSMVLFGFACVIALRRTRR